MKPASLSLAFTPPALTRLPARSLFLARPQLLTRDEPLPVGRDIPAFLAGSGRLQRLSKNRHRMKGGGTPCAELSSWSHCKCLVSLSQPLRYKPPWWIHGHCVSNMLKAIARGDVAGVLAL